MRGFRLADGSQPASARGDRASHGPAVYRGRQLPWLLLVVVVLGFGPQVVGGTLYRNGLLVNLMINAVLVLGFFWCFTVAGRFTFAVYAMYATGAYVSVWASNHFGGFWSGLVAAALVTAVVGYLTGWLFARLGLIYFAIATMAVGALLIILYRQWISFTGGYSGIGNIATPSLFGTKFDTYESRYYLYLAIFAGCLLLTVLMIRSPANRDLSMSRDLGTASATIGLKRRELQLVAFAVGSAMQGMAGSLYAHNSTYFSLDSFGSDISVNVLIAIILGGATSIYGPLIGATLLLYIPEYLRSTQKYSDIIYAGIVLIVIVVFPGGIAQARVGLSRLAAHVGRH